MSKTPALFLVPLLFIPALAFADAPPAFAVPFGCGLTFPVSQTHGYGSHVDNDTWAWDFRMPVGTPVTAAGDGIVRMARGDSTSGACDPRYAGDANYVVIDHPNGYETQYLHFSKVFVKPGDVVKQGEVIGLSGETGWACGAHLHFKVAIPKTQGWNNPSVPARLVGYGDPKVETMVSSVACKRPDLTFASRDQAASRGADKAQVTQALVEHARDDKPAEHKMDVKAAIAPATLVPSVRLPGRK